MGIIAFCPPTIEHGKVQATVRDNFHPRCSGRFHRTARVVEPNIYPLHQIPRHVEFVIFEEDKLTADILTPRKVNDLADQILPSIVLGVRFAREYELNGLVGAVQDPLQAVDVTHQQIAALVGCEAAGKPDRQDVRVQNFGRLFDFPLARTALGVLRGLIAPRPCPPCGRRFVSCAFHILLVIGDICPPLSKSRGWQGSPR